MNARIIRILISLFCGLVFGFGLSLSGMLNPLRVRGFLDITGQWDPSLAFVLGGAVAVAAVGWLVVGRLKSPAFDEEFHLPATTPVDRRLVAGSVIFGIGWGMAGFCPGPAIASLSLGLLSSFIFVSAMLAGMLVHDRLIARPAASSGS